MKLPYVLTCFCLLGATGLAWSQAKEPVAHNIPGFLDPATGKFTTKAKGAEANPEATTASTSVLFRQEFQIKITNYDQNGTTAVCSVTLVSVGDSGGNYYYEEASVPATASSGGFTCTVPVLALWMLQTPSTDTVSASISVAVYTPGSQTGTDGVPTVYRSSSQSLTLPQPGNTQTVITNVNVSL